MRQLTMGCNVLSIVLSGVCAAGAAAASTANETSAGEYGPASDNRCAREARAAGVAHRQSGRLEKRRNAARGARHRGVGLRDRP